MANPPPIVTSTLIWSRYADRVGVNRVKSLESKSQIARARWEGLGGTRLRPGRVIVAFPWSI